MFEHSRDRKVMLGTLVGALLLSSIAVVATSIKLSTHNCSVAGHECEVEERLVEVIKEVNCVTYNDINKEEVTVAEWAILVELERNTSPSSRAKMITRLDAIRKEHAAKEGKAADVKRVAAKNALGVLKATTAKIEAENEKEKLAQHWVTLNADWGKAEEEQMQEALKRLKHMKLLALTIKQQYRSMMHSIYALDQLEFLESKGLLLEKPIPTEYGSGGKYGASNKVELYEREAMFFSIRR